MNLSFQKISKIVGILLLIIGIAIIPSLIVSIIYGENIMIRAFLMSMIPMIVVGIILILFTKPVSSNLRIREGVLIVALCWFLASIFGAIPYVLSGVVSSFADGFFESASGFSTTGATIIDDFSTVPKGLIFWRAFSHWLGGMGILVFAISILPALGIGALNLAKAETPGPMLDKVTTKISDNAKFLYIIYISLSVIQLILLLFGKLSLFDALIHTFGSMATSGLSYYPNGLAHFNSIYVEMVIITFCLLASVNFITYNYLLHRKWRDFFRDAEFRAFLLILGGFISLIFLGLWLSGTYETPLECLRHSFFQVASFISTSGYNSTNYSAWPPFCSSLLFILLIIGGCSSSTAGGIKIVRIMVMFKLIYRNFYKRLHPRSVVAVRLKEKTIAVENVSNITVFILVYIIVAAIGSLLLSLDGHDLTTTISAAVSSLSNTGSGLGAIADGNNYSIFSTPARLLLAILMIMGRLEIFTVLILLMPSYWAPGRQ